MTISEYKNNFPQNVQLILTQLHTFIKGYLPEAQEVISYGIPTFKTKRNIIHYAAFKNHIGIYPGPTVIEQLHTDLQGYKTSKGAIQFPLTQPIPYLLVEKIILSCKQFNNL